MTPRLLKSFLLAALMPVSAAAADLPPLSENQRVISEFFAAAVGDKIRKNCPTISARMFYVLSRARELERYALSLGYTRDDIEALDNDRAAKERLEAMRDAYLEQNGVVKGDPESYCRLGRQEIANDTFIGSLIRSR